MEGRVYATACMQINAFLYLPNSQYARLHPTYLATGGTVKSENVSTTLLPIADNFVTRVFRIFVSFGALVDKSIRWRNFKTLFASCIRYIIIIHLLLVSISLIKLSAMLQVHFNFL